MKLCFAASSGGHTEELSRLRSLAGESDFVLTERSSYSVIDWCPRVYEVSQINRREPLFVLKFIALCVKSIHILRKERPDAVISTGALATFPICLFAKLMGKKVIYIESFARVDAGSLTGKLLYRVADLFLVQWEEMLKVFPGATYVGGIF